jgi:hypothetical protein
MPCYGPPDQQLALFKREILADAQYTLAVQALTDTSLFWEPNPLGVPPALPGRQ